MLMDNQQPMDADHTRTVAEHRCVDFIRRFSNDLRLRMTQAPTGRVHGVTASDAPRG